MKYINSVQFFFKKHIEILAKRICIIWSSNLNVLLSQFAIDVKCTDTIAYLVVFSCKHLHSHDCKDEPENKTDQEHIKDAWDGLYQGIDHDL